MVDAGSVVVDVVLAVKVLVVVLIAWTSVPHIVADGYSRGVNCPLPLMGGHLTRAGARPRMAGMPSLMDRFLGT